MTVMDPDDSVRDEQFDAENKSAETNGEKAEAEEKKSDTGKTEAEEKEPDTEKAEAEEKEPDTEKAEAEERKPDTEKAEAEEKSADTGKTEAEEKEPDTEKAEAEEKSADTGKTEAEEKEPDTEKAEAEAEKTGTASTTADSKSEPGELPEVDYSGRTQEELIETLELLIENRPLHEINDDVEKIKTLFYKKHKAETDQKKQKFMDDGGRIEDYKPADDPLEIKMKGLLARYRGKRTEYNKQLETQKKENLKKKYDIIDGIKDLVNREESINKTFQEFRDLQAEWHSVGPVPQSSLRNLWETYNLNVEIFYDYIKINKELRDLDFKKNLEIKIKLCEKAEDLLMEPNPVNAFRVLQEYHQQWRETGPVPRESRTELWERFKAATSVINRRHHEYFEKQKDQQRKNLEAKTSLCEKVEEINQLSLDSFKDWEKRAREVIELQRVWRTIGFAPKKHNNSIYHRFRTACDAFFQAKRRFYAENKEQQMENLQKKTELCMQAEEYQESTDWKEATDVLINLQKEWKEIGSVPRKYSDKIWKRFRKACDRFFERKAEHFASMDSSFEDNLKEKEKLIEELENFESGANIKEAFEKLKDIQKKWTEIGFVPYKAKDAIINRYRDALNEQFDRLKIDDEEKAILKYQTKLDNIKETPKAVRKLRGDREKFLNKMKQLENDIVVWENNIGFFSKSSNAESMIQEVQSKIDNAKKTIEILEEKIRLIDQSGIDD